MKNKLSSIPEIKSAFNLILAIRQALRNELADIDELDVFSDSAKASMKEKATENTKARLAAIAEATEAMVAKLEEEIGVRNHFDYADPKLAAAVAFIQTSGQNLPESAWTAMLKDFDGRPSELFYLSTLFNEQHLFEAAQTAKEAGQRASLSESFPQQLSDFIYFITQADPTANVDFSSYVAELDRIADVEQDDAEQDDNSEEA